MNTLRLHNATWPGLVGKGSNEGQEPPISLAHMIERTAAADADGESFEGIDLILQVPHIDPDGGEDELDRVADLINSENLSVGTLVAPVWVPYGGSAMGSAKERNRFLAAVKRACEIAGFFEHHTHRTNNVIRIDSAEFGISKWKRKPAVHSQRIIDTFQEAARIAEGYGQRLAAEGEICWAGMHSWRDMLDILEGVDMPGRFGFQADLAHTYLYLLGYNAPEHALLAPGYSDEEFWSAYEIMTDALRPWTIDIHIAQNDGTVFGAGSHEKTGKHCPVDDPNGKLDIVRCAQYWLKDAAKRGIKHICWDGCMFPNATLEDQSTWNKILDTMVEVRYAYEEERNSDQ